MISPISVRRMPHRSTAHNAGLVEGQVAFVNLLKIKEHKTEGKWWMQEELEKVASWKFIFTSSGSYIRANNSVHWVLRLSIHQWAIGLAPSSARRLVVRVAVDPFPLMPSLYHAELENSLQIGLIFLVTHSIKVTSGGGVSSNKHHK